MLKLRRFLIRILAGRMPVCMNMRFTGNIVIDSPGLVYRSHFTGEGLGNRNTFIM